MPPSYANTSAKDAALYGAPSARSKKSAREISSSGTLAFTSQLSSLVSTLSANNTASRPPRTSSRTKEDIFKTHNKGSKKRALQDLQDDGVGGNLKQKHSTSSDALDTSAWHRSKRKMEDKARLYAAMKRGDVDDADDKYAVDFDRKWAEKQGAQNDSDQGESASDVDSEDEADKETVEWTDEFGRTRETSRKEMLWEQRQQHLNRELSARARPNMPTNIIYGDTVQAAAFNPDEDRAKLMQDLAAKRDKETTPPPDTHFDSSKEVRAKGVGFMQFSLDESHRKQQMENLIKEREETDTRRKERETRLQDRKAEVERRKKEIADRRGKRKADDFLHGLSNELAEKSTGVGHREPED